MAKFNTNNEFDILAAAGTYTCNLNEPVDRYDIITSAGATTIAGTATINTSGTAYEGTTLHFRYLANITGGTMDVLGVNVPTHLLAKSMLIEAYYDGSAWDVKMFPDMNQSGIIAPGAITYSSNFISFNTAVNKTANVAGDQLLTTLQIPADTFTDDTDLNTVKLVLWGNCTTNPAELKTIKVKTRTGATTIDIYENFNTTDIIGSFRLEVDITVTTLSTGELIASGVLFSEASAGASSDVYVVTPRPTGYDETVIQYIDIYGAESTPSGSQITIEGSYLINV